MRIKCLGLLLLLLNPLATATTYYVSSVGEDTWSGTSETAPWKTITKVNSIISTLKGGDKILFRRGDIFSGTLKISASGINGNPVIIGSYGTGSSPVISGFATLTSWTSSGTGIYKCSLPASLSVNMVTLNGVPQALGRFPNQDFLIFESHTSNTSITDKELTGTPNWTGAEVVLKLSRYEIYRIPISNHTAGTITFKTNQFGEIKDGYGYFIQKDLRTLDTFGEWYHDGTYLYMYFGTSDPASYTVKAGTNDRLVYINNANHVTIENLAFEGANTAAVVVSKYNYITIQNCKFDHIGKYAFMYSYNAEFSNSLKIDNCSINNALDSGIRLDGKCLNSIITNNKITNCGLLAGMGNKDGQSFFGGIYCVGSKGRYEYNIIENVGRNGIWFHGDSSLVKNNFINKFCLVLDDAGGIYLSDWALTYGKKITGNIVLNGVGNNEGIPVTTSLYGEGIYLDYGTKNVEISGNTTANCGDAGIKLHCAESVLIENNTSFNNLRQIMLLQSKTEYPVKDLIINGNIFFSKKPVQLCLLSKSNLENLKSFGKANYNYYARPADDDEVFYTYSPATGSKMRTLSGWQSFTGQDLMSKKSSLVISDTSEIDFYYNAGKTSKQITLSQAMTDVEGKKYENSITLAPFTSIILMVDPNPDQPVVPKYVSSAIQNSTPDILEITYSTNLAATPMPPADAFTVKINDIPVTVTKVTISGNKILLTLAEPVKYGDKATVEYTQPESDKLQTSKGTPAESTTAQTVKINLLDPAVKNDPPVVSLMYKPETFSGFVYELDASGTTDPDNDELTYEWTVPASIPVSGTTGPIIRFLAPMVIRSETIRFTLKVSDGRSTGNKEFGVDIMPYKPELGMVKISKTEASGYYQNYYPGNATDGSLSSVWSAEGDNQWIQLNLSAPNKISHLQVAFLSEQKYESYFDIYVSKDNMIWEPVFLKTASCYFSGAYQVFSFPETKSGTEYSFIKLVGHGNSLDSWNKFSEIKVFGSDGGNSAKSAYNSGLVTIYPNPVKELLNLLILEPSSDTQSMRIYNSSGSLCLEKALDPGINYFNFPLSLKPGIYIVKILQSGLITHTQKLIVV